MGQLEEEQHLIKKIDKDNYTDVIDDWVIGQSRDVKLLMMKDHHLNDLNNSDIIKYGFDNDIVVVAEKFGRYQIIFSFYSELI